MMVKTIKRFWWVLGLLLATIWGAMRGRNPWQCRAERAQDAAAQAHHDLIDAEADAAKAVNKNESDNAHSELDNMSDDDLFNDALERVRPKPGGS